MDKEILACIPTYGRYDTTLPLTIASVLGQTMLPDKLIIFDNNKEKKNLLDIPHYKYLFEALNLKGVEREVMYCENKGQVVSHQTANKMGYKYVWRLDDDIIPESNVLETLYSLMDDSVGSIGGSIIIPSLKLPIEGKSKNLISDLHLYNAQWYPIDKVQQVQHLNCSYLYRAGIVNYNLGLSRIGHREETMHSYGFIQEGYKVLIAPCTTWHLKNPVGGIRDGEAQMFEHDEQLFLGNLKYGKIIVLDNGLGDHIIFKKLLPEIKAKYKHYTLALCYPDVFPGEPTMSIGEAKYLLGDTINEQNIYKRCVDHNWKDELLLAYRLMLGLK